MPKREDIYPELKNKIKSYVNIDTGEVFKLFEEDTKKSKRSRYFKAIGDDFVNAARMLDKSAVDAYIYMARHMTYYNLYLGTYEMIRAALNVNIRTVTNIMVALQEHDLIRRRCSTQWMLNPKIVARCSDEDEEFLFEIYNSLTPYSERKRRRKKVQDDVD